MSEHLGGPLQGLRIIEIGTMIAGPVCCTLLGDFGADVIKVEQPEGDPLRHSGPRINGEGIWFQVEDRNKRSITCDLRTAEGQEYFKRLVRTADVVVENFRPGTLARWSVSFDDLIAENPKLVMLSVSGFGQTGPYAQRAAYDRIALAFSGLLNATGFPDRPPLRPATSIADYQAALYGAFAVMAAVYHRDVRGGTGQHLDLSLYESVFRFTDMMVTANDALGIKRERRGNLHFAAAPGDHFPTQDGRYIVVTCSNNAVFRRLAEAIGRPDLPTLPAFDTHDHRFANIEALNAIVAEWIVNRPVDTVSATFEAAGIAYSLIFAPEDILADPHYAARGSVAEVDTRAGKLKMPAVFPRMSVTKAPPIRQAPSLGEHNDEVRREVEGAEREIASRN